MHIYVIQNGETALHIACSEGHMEVIHLLLQNGSDVNLQDQVRNI